MNWWHAVSYFIGGALLTNAIPHLVAGMQGESFRTPFSRGSPSGVSPPRVNVMWAFTNLVLAYALTVRVELLDLSDIGQVGPAGLGGLVIAMHLAKSMASHRRIEPM